MLAALGPNAPPHLYDVEVGLHATSSETATFLCPRNGFRFFVPGNFHMKKQSFLIRCIHARSPGFARTAMPVSRFTEVLKLLKALQFEIAASWASMWRGMLQEN